MAYRPVTLQHPTVGSIQGTMRSKAVEQYLGIQYARLADRFARGALVESYSSPVDATTHGPLPIANPANCDQEHRLLQHPLPHPDYTFSDTECLTLNVTVPNAEIRAKQGKALPVLVFIHGGGLVTGSASWPQWDLAKIVEMSVDCGRPMIAVAMNYRLGPFGFMTSAAMREAGYRKNNGLHDQKLALAWVRRYIGGFGGDPGRVTVLGSSIGATSGFYHLQSEEPLFHQLAAHGSTGLTRPLPSEFEEVGYGMVVKALGIESLEPAEQVKELLRVPHDELEVKIREYNPPMSAWIDDEILRGVLTYEGLDDPGTVKDLLPGMRSCRTIWMGGCELDGNIFVIMTMARKEDPAITLTRCISIALAATPDIISSILSLFKLPGPSDTTPEDKRMAVAIFLTEVYSSRSAWACAQSWKTAGKSAFLTSFDCPNPWDGAWKGYASHGLDGAFMLQNYNEYLPGKHRTVAKAMGQDLVAFVNGEALPGCCPSDNSDVPSKSYRVNRSDGTVAESASSREEELVRLERRNALEQIVGGRAEVLDRLMDALVLFMSGA